MIACGESSPLFIRSFNRFGSLLTRSRWVEIPFERSALMETAARQTGLHDFGEPAFHEPLDRLARSLREEAPLTLLGQIVARQDLLGLLRERLKMEAARRANPGIAEEAIRQPLVIIGLPRAATTFFHILLAQDPANRTPLCWEVMYPQAASSPDPAEQERFRQAARRNLKWFHWMTPGIESIHEVEAMAPQECVAIMSYSFESSRFETSYAISSYQAWHENVEHPNAYAYHRRVLQLLQYGRPPARWILKAPSHLEQLPALAAEYPDARFVLVHRDPLKIIPSNVSLTCVLRGSLCESQHAPSIADAVARRWMRLLNGLAPVRRQIDPAGEKFFDLEFGQVTANPVEAVENLYAWMGWTLSETARHRMQAYIERRRNAQIPPHRYTLEDAGLDPNDLRERFRPYTDAFDVPLEVEPK